LSQSWNELLLLKQEFGNCPEWDYWVSSGRNVVHFSLEVSIERICEASEYHCTNVSFVQWPLSEPLIVHTRQRALKDREGRKLTYDELAHYQKVMVALKETIRLMVEIDELIPGWPVEWTNKLWEKKHWM